MHRRGLGDRDRAGSFFGVAVRLLPASRCTNFTGITGAQTTTRQQTRHRGRRWRRFNCRSACRRGEGVANRDLGGRLLRGLAAALARVDVALGGGGHAEGAGALEGGEERHAANGGAGSRPPPRSRRPTARGRPRGPPPAARRGRARRAPRGTSPPPAPATDARATRARPSTARCPRRRPPPRGDGGRLGGGGGLGGLGVLGLGRRRRLGAGGAACSPSRKAVTSSPTKERSKSIRSRLARPTTTSTVAPSAGGGAPAAEHAAGEALLAGVVIRLPSRLSPLASAASSAVSDLPSRSAAASTRRATKTCRVEVEQLGLGGGARVSAEPAPDARSGGRRARRASLGARKASGVARGRQRRARYQAWTLCKEDRAAQRPGLELKNGRTPPQWRRSRSAWRRSKWRRAAMAASSRWAAAACRRRRRRWRRPARRRAGAAGEVVSRVDVGRANTARARTRRRRRRRRRGRGAQIGAALEEAQGAAHLREMLGDAAASPSLAFHTHESKEEKSDPLPLWRDGAPRGRLRPRVDARGGDRGARQFQGKRVNVTKLQAESAPAADEWRQAIEDAINA